MATYKSETAREISLITDALIWILGHHFQIHDIQDISSASDDTLKKMLFCLPQIFDEMKDPAIIPSILSE